MKAVINFRFKSLYNLGNTPRRRREIYLPCLELKSVSPLIQLSLWTKFDKPVAGGKIPWHAASLISQYFFYFFWPTSVSIFWRIYVYIYKFKWSRYRPGVAQRVGRGIALLFHDRGALEGGEWPAARPGRTLPPVKTRYPFYRKLGGPQSWSGREENLVPTGIRSQTVQSVVSRYTDWATRSIYIYIYIYDCV